MGKWGGVNFIKIRVGVAKYKRWGVGVAKYKRWVWVWLSIKGGGGWVWLSIKGGGGCG